MREIKFRAWSVKEKCWCSAFCIHMSGLFSDLINAKIENDHPVVDAHWQDLSEQDEIIVMQFTGEIDSTGKEIYEGDILDSQSGNKFKVVFEYGCFMKQHIGDDRPTGYLYEVAESFWIIGNIYEDAQG